MSTMVSSLTPNLSLGELSGAGVGKSTISSSESTQSNGSNLLRCLDTGSVFVSCGRLGVISRDLFDSVTGGGLGFSECVGSAGVLLFFGLCEDLGAVFLYIDVGFLPVPKNAAPTKILGLGLRLLNTIGIDFFVSTGTAGSL